MTLNFNLTAIGNIILFSLNPVQLPQHNPISPYGSMPVVLPPNNCGELHSSVLHYVIINYYFSSSIVSHVCVTDCPLLIPFMLMSISTNTILKGCRMYLPCLTIAKGPMNLMECSRSTASSCLLNYNSEIYSHYLNICVLVFAFLIYIYIGMYC